MKNVLVIGVVILLVAAGYFIFKSGGGEETDTTPQLGVPAPGFEGVPETVVGPSGDEEAMMEGSSAKEISMVSGNVFFNPKNLTLTKGQPVKITFSNTGTHTFTVDELGVDQSFRGSTATVEFTPTKRGTFEYYCKIPGHKEGGMFGSLTVE